MTGHESPATDQQATLQAVDEEELFPYGYCTATKIDGTMCDKPTGHDGVHRRRPLHNEHPVIEWTDEDNCQCPGCRVGTACEWHLQKCSHPRDRSCDSRCNDDAAHPWHRGEDDEERVYAHAWCLPQHYTREGWRRGPDVTVQLVETKCERCGGAMDRWPR